MNNYNGDDYQESTILNPVETRFNVDGQIFDLEHLDETNKQGVYTFKFAPETPLDYSQVEEAGQKAIDLAYQGLDRFSNKKLELAIEDKHSFYYCSQLFKPKCNVKFLNPYELEGRHAAMTFHFRDTHSGLIYLQCEYLDVYQIQQSPEVIEHLVAGNLTEQELEDMMF